MQNAGLDVRDADVLLTDERGEDKKRKRGLER